MKLLFATNDPTQIAFAQALLSGEGIASFELDVHTSVLEGSAGAVPRRLMVADRDLFLARSILRDLGLVHD
jgi:Putative prokaryotic signal transducing protein